MDTKSKQIRILVFSVPSWNSKIGANSWASLLESYSPDQVACVSIRDDVPDSPVCSRYFTISENRVLQSIYRRGVETGYEVTPASYEEGVKDLEAQQTRYRKYQSKRNYPMLMARELVWKLGKWKTKEFNEFLDSFRPTLILHSMDGYIHMNKIVEYAIRRTKAKAIGYIWDDNFTYIGDGDPGFYVYRFFQRRSLKHLAKMTDSFLAISEQTKQEADRMFQINSTVITKPLNRIPSYQEQEYNLPVRMLYTGSLIIGRKEALQLLIKALDHINTGRMYFEIDVYTNTDLSEADKLQLERPFCRVHKAIPQQEVLVKQQDADVLLFFEAVEGKYVTSARLSFSTKITDYLSAGRAIIAIGNAQCYPLRYFENNDSAIVAFDEAGLKKILERIVGEPQLLNRYAQQSLQCAVQNHHPDHIISQFNRVIQNTVEGWKSM